MYLKSLTALGFKSFADKTTLHFQPGVTAIVGPNGCGKSNISDAIRWVLGEQSAKALRGGEMADVIFNGTDGRKPVSMAEVSLTIGDVDEEHLKAAGVDVSFNEVTITRRVFRDGGSEYFINKTSCRLKDIQQLFMGTGMGRSSYSIMAQGNITQIISSKPDDRRMVFEEAAGITKFKAQKKEALRKLEHTDQNLLRMQDLIREVKRQIGSLQRQAGKAKRYKSLMSEMQYLDTQLARHHYDVYREGISTREASLKKLTIESEVCQESVIRAEGEVAQLRERLGQIDADLLATQQLGQEVKAQTDRNASRIHFNEERLKELESQKSKALGDIAGAEERHVAAEIELVSIQSRLAESTRQLEEHRQQMQARREALQGVESSLMQRQDVVRKAQSELFSTAQALSRARNEINSLDLQKQGNLVRLEKLHAEKIQLDEETTRLETRLREFAANVETDRQGIVASRGTLEEKQKRLKEIQEELHKSGQALDILLRQQAEKKSRLHILDQLQHDYEGFSSGAVSILKGSPGVHGSLTDRLRVADPHVVAVESALGQQLQLVVSEDAETARKIVAALHADKKGRASIAALSLSNLIGPETDQAVAPANTTLLIGLIDAEESVLPLLARLLSGVCLAADLAIATDAWQTAPGRFSFVTPSGEILSREGVYSGGTGAGKTSSSVLARKNQIIELKAQIDQLVEQVEQASRQKGTWQSEQTAIQSAMQQTQSELRTQEVAVATRQGEFNALQNSRRSLQQKVQNTAYEIQRLSAQEAEGQGKRELLAANVATQEQKEQTLQQQVAEVTQEVESLRQQRDGATSSLNETRVGLATEEQLCNSLRQQSGTIQNRIRELTVLLDSRRVEIQSFAGRKERFELEIAESQTKIESLNHDREQINGQLTELLLQKQTQELGILEREEILRSQRRRLGELQQSKSQTELELAQKQMGSQNLRERILEKYQTDLENVRSECITITVASEGPVKIETLTTSEMEEKGLSTDWELVAQQVASMQKRVEEIGPVNLVAIEEYEETEQRHTFLTAQHDDLVKAKEQLMEVLNTINGQTREMFLETFNKIRDNFRTLFVEIFGGGKADLILVDEADCLESGIEIVARPPGKQLQSISLLSGGEQTMTAVALLFSIYQVKPSPFCVLDELDAPLDESNINRFVRILQRFLSLSQFVIITHNKRTISMADVLYGVTMEEHGVSKIVSVKFHKADDLQSESSAESRPLVPPAAMQSLAEDTDRVNAPNETFELAGAE